MDYKRFDDTILVRMDRGEEILEQVKAVALKEHVTLASVQALGAINDFTVGVYNVAEKKYYANDFKGSFDLRCCLMVFPQTYFPRVTQNYNCIMQKSGERKISSASKLSRNYSFADKQERTVGRSKVVRKFLYRNFLPPEVQKG